MYERVSARSRLRGFVKCENTFDRGFEVREQHDTETAGHDQPQYIGIGHVFYAIQIGHHH